MSNKWAYYNEIDPFAAQWLRNLMSAGLIAQGVVDERSISDVKPAEIQEFTQCHFFAGIGVWSYALRSAGWHDHRPVWTGSCPCQPFSSAGKGNGFLDERHLWPHWFHLIQMCRPIEILVSKLQARTDLLGSTLFKLTWKNRDTPTQHSIYALRASVLRTSGKDSGSMQGEGLPTPQAVDASGTARAPRLKPDTKRDPLKIGSYRIDLKDLPFLIFSKPPYEEAQWNWNTPSATDYKGGYQGGRIRNGKLSTYRLDVTAQLTQWPTPCASTVANQTNLQKSGDGRKTPNKPDWAAALTQLKSLPTPNANNWRGAYTDLKKIEKRKEAGRQQNLQDTARLMGFGLTQTGSTVEMENVGQLNPALSRWLMSLPPEWCENLPTLKQLETIQKSGKAR